MFPLSSNKFFVAFAACFETTNRLISRVYVFFFLVVFESSFEKKTEAEGKEKTLFDIEIAFHMTELIIIGNSFGKDEDDDEGSLESLYLHR